MLAALLTDSDELRPLKRLIINRTGGNPFFMEEMVQALFDNGTLGRNGSVRVVHPLSQLRLPPSVQGILASRIDRQPREHKQLLQTLAVIGRESPLTLIRQLSSHAEGQLDRMLTDLQAAEFIYERPGRAGAEYVFKHALTQEVAYSSLLIERRKQLHERAGAGLESIFARRLDDHLSELAHHYSHSDNVKKAIEYLTRAGEQAMQRSAHADAVTNLQAAFELLPRLPEGQERIQRELSLRLAVAPGFIVLKGWGAPEVLESYVQAQELCMRLGDPPELQHAWFGLWTTHFLRDELPQARELAEKLLRRAQSTNDQAPLILAHHALGDTLYQMGELLLARKNLEKAIALYDRTQHRLLALRFSGLDSEVGCLSYLSYTLWELGYPDQAIERCSRAVSLADEMSHPYSLVFAEAFMAYLRLYRREPSDSLEPASRFAALCIEHGFSGFSAQIPIFRGWAMAAQGRNDEGITLMRDSLAAMRAVGMELARPMFVTRLAEAYIQIGRFDEARSALDEALAAAQAREDRQHEAERHRLMGELLLRQDAPNIAEAGECFARALETARKQQAKIFELRATMSMARLLARCGRAETAHEMLTNIYNWFSEGFETPDLKDAKRLFNELAG
jgi:predicted ATPase